MKKLILNFGLFSLMALSSAACGNSKGTDAADDSANQAKEPTEVVADVEEQSAADPNAPFTAEDEAEVLRILKQIHIIQHSLDTEEQATPYFSKKLIQKIKDAPNRFEGMTMAVCFYGEGTVTAEVDPETIKIVKFDPATGKVTYKLDVKITDDIDGTTDMLHPRETATFIREDGKIVLDETSAETLLS